MFTSIEQTIKSMRCIGKTLSRISMSRENRDKMRPMGVVSKKSIGACCTPKALSGKTFCLSFFVNEKSIELFFYQRVYIYATQQRPANNQF